MAVTYGFYNSVDGDRKYNAEQFGSIFDGIINDGIYQAIGEAFAVKANAGMNITVGTGRAWFNHTWTLNDSTLSLAVPQADLLLPRIDTVVIEVDRSDGVRANSIKIIQGVKTTNPVAPTLTKSDPVWQYPLADINVSAGATAITAADITNRRGAAPSQWVTGPLLAMNADTLYSQFNAKFTNWFTDTQNKNNLAFSKFMSDNSSEFNAWMSELKDYLEGNTAAALTAKIIELENMLGNTTNGNIKYDYLRDSDGNSIIDSNDDVVLAKLVYVLA